MIYVFLVLRLLVGAAFIGVGATVVRKVKPLAGYLTIAAGAVIILGRCCTFGINEALPDFILLSPLQMMNTLLVFGLCVGAGVVLSVAVSAGPRAAAPADPATPGSAPGQGGFGPPPGGGNFGPPG